MNLGSVEVRDWDVLCKNTSLLVSNVNGESGLDLTLSLLVVVVPEPEVVPIPQVGKPQYFTNFLLKAKADLERELIGEIFLLESDLAILFTDGQLLSLQSDLSMVLMTQNVASIKYGLLTDHLNNLLISISSGLYKDATVKLVTITVPIKSIKMSIRKLKKLKELVDRT